MTALVNLGRIAFGRIATVVTVASAGLVVASPAGAAATLSATVSCESLGRQRVLCVSSVTGGAPPYTRQWFYNSTYFPSQDGRSTTNWSCVPGGTNAYSMAVVDANFEIVFVGTRSGCTSGNP